VHAMLPYAISDAVLSSSTVAEADYTAWSPPTAYSVGNRVIRTTGVHRIFERLVPGTTSTAPESDPVNWLNIGPTNRWAMFDGAVGTWTTGSSPLTVQLAMPAAYNDIVLLGVTGTQVQISVGGTLVRTVSVPAPAVAALGSTVVITGLAAAASTLQISLTGTGTLGIGLCAVGTLIYAGDTEAKPRLGLIDYSGRTIDDYGNIDIVQRGFARTIDAQVTLLPSGLDSLVRTLAALRSTPAIWMGYQPLGASLLYGWPVDWSLALHKGLVRGSIRLQSLAIG